MTVYITEAGGLQLLRAMRGESLIFTHVAIGSGSSANPTQATRLVHQQKYLSIDSTNILDGLLTIVCSFTNSDVATGFKITEYGIFAQDMDDANEEILYAYISQPYDTADYVPAGGDRPKSLQISPKVTIGDAQNISAVINSSLTYVSEAEFQTHTSNTSNPHNVTKAQIGLSNVENVAVNDMAPTFTDAQYSTENYNGLKLTSGTSLSTLFGKLKSFVLAVISHLMSRANPHEVTLDQLNGASRDHTHQMSDITQGTLPVSKGGTGLTEIPIGAVLIGNQSRVTARTGERAFYWPPGELAPKFGTLPIECGGTGKRTEAEYSADIVSRVTAAGFPVLIQGSYTGNGSTSTGMKLEFSKAPKLIVVTRESATLSSMEQGMGFFAVRGTTNQNFLVLEWGDDYVRFVGQNAGSNNTIVGMNQAGVKYYYIVLL